MGMTASQKILAAHAGLKEVKAGQLISAKLDLVLANDITGPVAIREFRKSGAQKVAEKDKIALVMDHFAPNKDIKSAEQCKTCRVFAKEQGIENFYDVGKMGIEHALLPELGLVGAGDLVIGADSHTCTYGALGAFSTGVGSTDMAAGMISQTCWFKVPSAIKFILHGKPAKYVCGKDLILHIIGMIGVDGALYTSMEFAGDGYVKDGDTHKYIVGKDLTLNITPDAGMQVKSITVNGESIQFTADSDKKVSVTINKLSTLDIAVEFTDITYTAEITGIHASYINSVNKIVAVGNNREVEISFVKSSSKITVEVPVGTWTLRLFNRNDQLLGTVENVTITGTETEIPSFTFVAA